MTVTSIRSFRHGAAIAALAVAALGATAGAQTYTWNFNLDGLQESPANASPGTGFGTITWDTATHLMHVHVDFLGLVGTTTASHIHASTLVAGTGNAGVATTTPSFTGFPLGVTSGTFDNTLDMTAASSYNPAYVTAQGSIPNAEAALLNAMLNNNAYLNIHSTAFPGGEIRGFIPTPAAASLLAMSGLVAARRRRA